MRFIESSFSNSYQFSAGNDRQGVDSKQRGYLNEKNAGHVKMTYIIQFEFSSEETFLPACRGALR